MCLQLKTCTLKSVLAAENEHPVPTNICSRNTLISATTANDSLQYHWSTISPAGGNYGQTPTARTRLATRVLLRCKSCQIGPFDWRSSSGSFGRQRRSYTPSHVRLVLYSYRKVTAVACVKNKTTDGRIRLTGSREHSGFVCGCDLVEFYLPGISGMSGKHEHCM